MGNAPSRKPNRLENHDYAQPGTYFITICSKGHQQLFGTIALGSGRQNAAPTSLMKLSPIGRIVEAEIMRLSRTYEGVYVDCYVVMPNHVHMIIVIRNIHGRQDAAPTISQMMNQWKRAASIKAGSSIWQKSFHDHIIRNQVRYNLIVQYIACNPEIWEKDIYFMGPGRPYIAPSDRPIL